jgi:hypothetical protein
LTVGVYGTVSITFLFMFTSYIINISSTDSYLLLPATVEDYESGLEASLLRDKYAAAAAKGDTDRIIVWSGTGVGSMTRIQPAKVSTTTPIRF